MKTRERYQRIKDLSALLLARLEKHEEPCDAKTLFDEMKDEIAGDDRVTVQLALSSLLDSNKVNIDRKMQLVVPAPPGA